MKSLYIYIRYSIKSCIKNFYTITKSFSFHYREKQSDTYTQAITSVLVVFFFIWCTSSAFAMNPNPPGDNERMPLLGNTGSGSVSSEGNENAGFDDASNNGEQSNRTMSSSYSFDSLQIEDDQSGPYQGPCWDCLRLLGSTVTGVLCGMGVGGFASGIASAVYSATFMNVLYSMLFGSGIGGVSGGVVGSALGINMFCCEGCQNEDVERGSRHLGGYAFIPGDDRPTPPTPPSSAFSILSLSDGNETDTSRGAGGAGSIPGSEGSQPEPKDDVEHCMEGVGGGEEDHSSGNEEVETSQQQQQQQQTVQQPGGSPGSEGSQPEPKDDVEHCMEGVGGGEKDHSSGNEEVETSQQQQQQQQTVQQPGGSPPQAPCPMQSCPYCSGSGMIGGNTTSLLPGYNRASQMQSLLGLQGVLVEMSEQVSTTLKLLALKAQSSNFLKVDRLHERTMPFMATLRKPSRQVKTRRQPSLLQAFRPYTMFAFADGYTTNLEQKIRSSRAGLILQPVSKLKVGLAYTAHKDVSNEGNTQQLDAVSGSVEAKTTTDSLSAVVAWNTDDAGLTGHFVSCYGWGSVKNKRSFLHGEEISKSKGRPDINLGGALVQVGYTIPLTAYVVVTPYIECMMSRVTWGTYTEASGILPCEMSRNQEKIFERSLGLRNRWDVGGGSCVQTWISGILGRRTTTGLTSRPIRVSSSSLYDVSIPTYKKQYFRGEIGIAYETQLMETITIGLNGKTRFKKIHTMNGQQIGIHMRYLY